MDCFPPLWPVTPVVAVVGPCRLQSDRPAPKTPAPFVSIHGSGDPNPSHGSESEYEKTETVLDSVRPQSATPRQSVFLWLIALLSPPVQIFRVFAPEQGVRK